MDEILYLDSDGEINLVIDKIKQLTGRSVALVVPKNSPLLSSIVNLKILQKEAKRLKKSISLVTQDRIGIRLANQLGIPVYRSTEDDTPIISAEEKSMVDEVIRLDLVDEVNQTQDGNDVKVKYYRQEEIREADSSHAEQTAKSSAQSNQAEGLIVSNHKKLLLVKLGFFLIVLLIGAWWLFAFVPRATIFLTLSSEPIKATVTVIADNNINQVDPGTGHIPGQKLEVEAKFKDTFIATGQKEVGTKASGEVVISNRLGQVVDLSAGIKFSRNELIFIAKEAVQVGAATVSLDSQGEVAIKPGTAKVTVEAEQPGEAYNITTGALIITSLSGVKREKVTAENKTALVGGESKVVTVFSDDDLTRSKTEITSKHQPEILEDLRKKGDELNVIGGSEEITLFEAKSNKDVGDETADFELEATLKARSIGFASIDYQKMVVNLVNQKLASDRELIVAEADSIETEVIAKDYSQGLLSLKAVLDSKIVKKINQDEIGQLVVGQSALVAKEILTNQVTGIESVRVNLKPSFRSHLPKNISQIEIVVE